MSIPLYDDCDPDDPHEAFTWALVGLPGPRNAPLMVHPDVLRQWSKHLWDLGFRHDPQVQTKEYHSPARGVTHWLNGSGRWVPAGTPQPPQASAPDMSQLTAEERAHVVAQLRESGDLAHLVDMRELPVNLAAVNAATELVTDGPDSDRASR
ncbi:phage gene 29 protein family protein [Nocardia nepalensis]|uniref:phage gene 29 protein family protein n=1 Tax=Nocardia nepalensis TaxID=3375448 RepID=UPI003B673E89